MKKNVLTFLCFAVTLMLSVLTVSCDNGYSKSPEIPSYDIPKKEEEKTRIQSYATDYEYIFYDNSNNAYYTDDYFHGYYKLNKSYGDNREQLSKEDSEKLKNELFEGKIKRIELVVFNRDQWYEDINMEPEWEIEPYIENLNGQKFFGEGEKASRRVIWKEKDATHDAVYTSVNDVYLFRVDFEGKPERIEVKKGEYGFIPVAKLTYKMKTVFYQVEWMGQTEEHKYEYPEQNENIYFANAFSSFREDCF